MPCKFRNPRIFQNFTTAYIFQIYKNYKYTSCVKLIIIASAWQFEIQTWFYFQYFRRRSLLNLDQRKYLSVFLSRTFAYFTTARNFFATDIGSRLAFRQRGFDWRFSTSRKFLRGIPDTSTRRSDDRNADHNERLHHADDRSHFGENSSNEFFLRFFAFEFDPPATTTNGGHASLKRQQSPGWYSRQAKLLELTRSTLFLLLAHFRFRHLCEKIYRKIIDIRYKEIKIYLINKSTIISFPICVRVV